MNNCENCGESNNSCTKELCLKPFHPLTEGCGAEHIQLTPAPNQCISAGDFLKCNSDGLIEVWQPGDSEPVVAIAFKSYNVDAAGMVDCNTYFINGYICGYFRVPDHLMADFAAIICMGNSGIKKITGNTYTL